MLDKISKCKFCKGEVVKVISDEQCEKYAVVCDNCDCHGPVKSSPEEAISSWNLLSVVMIDKKDFDAIIDRCSDAYAEPGDLREIKEWLLSYVEGANNG